MAAHKCWKHGYRIAIVHLSGWWKQSTSGLIAVINLLLVELIAAWARAVPTIPIPERPLRVLCRFLSHGSLVESAMLCRGGLGYLSWSWAAAGGRTLQATRVYQERRRSSSSISSSSSSTTTSTSSGSSRSTGSRCNSIHVQRLI